MASTDKDCTYYVGISWNWILESGDGWLVFCKIVIQSGIVLLQKRSLRARKNNSNPIPIIDRKSDQSGVGKGLSTLNFPQGKTSGMTSWPLRVGTLRKSACSDLDDLVPIILFDSFSPPRL